MLEHHRGFLQDIIAHPGDDTPRLIYADWFEDTGAPAFAAYADYVRLECSGADPSRSAALLTAHARKWNGLAHRLLRGGAFLHRVDARQGLIRGWQYRRGFIAGLTVEPDAVTDGAYELFRLGPVERLRVVGIDRELGPLLDALAPFPLRELELRFRVFGELDADALRFAGREPLARLDALRVEAAAPVGRGVVESLTRDQGFKNNVRFSVRSAGTFDYQGTGR